MSIRRKDALTAVAVLSEDVLRMAAAAFATNDPDVSLSDIACGALVTKMACIAADDGPNADERVKAIDSLLVSEFGFPADKLGIGAPSPTIN